MIGAKLDWWLDLYYRHLVSRSAIGMAISLARYASKRENSEHGHNSYHRGVVKRNVTGSAQLLQLYAAIE